MWTRSTITGLAPPPLVGLIFLKILSLIVNIGVDTIGIRFCNWKILKKVVTNFSSGGHQKSVSPTHLLLSEAENLSSHQVVWILVLVQVMFDCFQAWKLAQNQAWKQSNMACSTSAEEDFQARAALLLLLHWSYSHQPDFLDEDTVRYWAKHWSSNALRRCNCKVILVLLQYFLLTFPI